jgi:elongation factor Ts
MEITAELVKKLRDKTGAGMMDCKKALAESNGDMDQAIDYLRKKGAATAEKRADRSANEGIIVTGIENGLGAMVEVNCETDFVARSNDFVDFARRVLHTVHKHKPVHVDALLDLDHEGTRIADHLTETIGKIGEKIAVKRFAVFQGANSVLVDYIHPGAKLGVMIELSCDTDCEDVRNLGKDLAMQVAAMSPIAVDRNAVPESVREHEMEIYRQQAREMGKPEQMLDKIAEGKLNKFYQEFTLLEQSFIRDNTKTVKEHVDDVAKAVGKPVSVVRFERFQIGAE